jgi:hypothetical protein
MESSTAPRRATGAATLPEAFRITAADRAGDIAIRTRADEVTLTWGRLRERVDAGWPASAWGGATRSGYCSPTGPTSTSATWPR